MIVGINTYQHAIMLVVADAGKGGLSTAPTCAYLSDLRQKLGVPDIVGYRM
jgi:hypothetical protein